MKQSDEAPRRRVISRITPKAMAAILAVLIALIAVAVVWKYATTPDPKWDYLTVRVNASAGVRWELYLPLPIEQNGTPWYLVSSLELVEGQANASVADTPYGSALHLAGEGNARFHVAMSARGTPYATVVPQNLTLTGGELKYEGFIPCMVYADAGGLEGNLTFSFSAGAYANAPHRNYFKTVLYALEGYLESGWQELTAGQGMAVDG